MSEYWVLVADESRARLFSTDKIRVALNEFEDVINPEGRLRNQEIYTDEAGRGRGLGGPGGHAMELADNNPQEQVRRFCKQLVERLSKGLHKRAYRKLILIAPPSFIGLLRQQLPDGVQAHVQKELVKDLTADRADSILQHINNH